MAYKLNDPIYVAHSGFVVTTQKILDPLALATIGFVSNDDGIASIVTARFCLYLLLKRDAPTLNTQIRLKPLVEVRKRNVPIVELSYRKAPTIETSYRLPIKVVTSRRAKPLIEVYIDSCN